MTEHVHGCLNCRPDMVPDFSKDDPRYHVSEKCGHFRPFLDGAEPGWTKGVFEGREGWVLLVCEGFDVARVHDCPNCTTRDADGFLIEQQICVESRFGNVEARHECPALSRYATGGTISASQAYVVGENGPDEIVPCHVWNVGNDGTGSGLDS